VTEFDRRPIEVLLVEDDAGDVLMTQEAFEDAQVANNLSVVSDGTEALEFLRRQGEYADAPRPDPQRVATRTPHTPMAARPASSRATGTRYGEQDT